MTIKKHSGIFTLKAEQFLPIPLEQAWEFFSTPKNLAKITPDFMGFNITSELADKMFPGQIITYKIGLFPGIKGSWVTEITHVNEPHFFVDEQRFGPYAMWHHEHHFKAHENGTLMEDKVSYKLPLGSFGALFHSILVKPKLQQIFNHRKVTLEKLFPA
ncbi:MAG: SRPBCC family protein [Luteibaculum sp.]